MYWGSGTDNNVAPGAVASASGEWASRIEAESEDAYKWLGEDKSCAPWGFAGSHISYNVLSENAKPNQQMKEFAVEMEQQRVCLHASLAKAERSVKRAAEKMASQQA